MILLLLILALAPCLFLLWYFYHRDKYEPEPKQKIIKIFLFGALMVIPAAIIESALLYGVGKIAGGILYTFIISFIIIAPTEELLKYFAVRKWIYKSYEFDEVMDGIVYTVSASLGFATVENIFYVISHGVAVGIARAVLAVPGHAFFGALMGYYIGLAKFNKEKENKLIMTGILLAILFHGLYDFLALTQTAFALLVFVVILVLGLIVRKNIKKAENQSKLRLKEEVTVQEDQKQDNDVSQTELPED